jgi:hypothetical protein
MTLVAVLMTGPYNPYWQVSKKDQLERNKDLSIFLGTAMLGLSTQYNVMQSFVFIADILNFASTNVMIGFGIKDIKTGKIYLLLLKGTKNLLTTKGV